MVTRSERVAVFGGDGRVPSRARVEGADVRSYRSPGDGGRNDVKRLEAALKAGSVDRVVILTRWNSHGSTQRIRAVCRRLGVPVDVIA